MRVSGESYALSALCLADLASTIFWVQGRDANEGNPLMAYYLAHGILAFITAKLILFVMPLFLAEYARRHRPRLVRLSLRATLAAYIFSYISVVVHLN